MDGSKIAPPASFEGRPLVDLDEQEPVEEQVDLGAGDRPFAEQRAFGQAGRAGGNPLIPGWRRPGTARRRPGRGQRHRFAAASPRAVMLRGSPDPVLVPDQGALAGEPPGRDGGGLLIAQVGRAWRSGCRFPPCTCTRHNSRRQNSRTRIPDHFGEPADVLACRVVSCRHQAEHKPPQRRHIYGQPRRHPPRDGQLKAPDQAVGGCHRRREDLDAYIVTPEPPRPSPRSFCSLLARAPARPPPAPRATRRRRWPPPLPSQPAVRAP